MPNNDQEQKQNEGNNKPSWLFQVFKIFLIFQLVKMGINFFSKNNQPQVSPSQGMFQLM